MAYSLTTSQLLESAVARPRGEAAGSRARLHDASLEELPAAAHAHGVGAYVYEWLQGSGAVDDRTLRQLRGLRDRNAFNHLRSIQDLRFLSDALDGEVPWLIIKGPTLAKPVHGGAHLRGYSDLDALVPGRDLRACLHALVAHGATIRDRNWSLIRDEMKGEVHVELPSGTALDLHWHLLNEPSRRSAFPIDIDALFDRSRSVDVDGATVRSLGPADNAVYVAMHTIHSGGHRLIWLKDVERLLAQDDLDPQEVAERALEWNAHLVLRAALLRTEGALGPLPHAATLRRLLPNARTWERVAAEAWRRCPAGTEDGTGSIGRVVARSVRTTQRHSFANLASRAYHHVRNRRAHKTDIEGPRHFAADDPRSDRYPAGGDAAREAFLDAVAGGRTAARA